MALVRRRALLLVHVRRVVTRGTHQVAPVGVGVTIVENGSHRGSARGGESICDVEVAMSAGAQTKAVQAFGNVKSRRQ